MKLPIIPEGLRIWLPYVALALVLLGPFALLRGCEEAREARTEARVSDAMGTSAAKSGKDAVEAAGGLADRAGETDAITREVEHAIRSANNPRAAHDHALDGLCRRAAYRCQQDCVQRSVASGVANAGAGCPASPK